jgi:hypothetical protein
MQSTTREGRRGYYLQTSLYLTTATAGDLSQSTVDAQLWMDAKTPSDSHLSKTLALVGTRDLNIPPVCRLLVSAPEKRDGVRSAPCVGTTGVSSPVRARQAGSLWVTTLSCTVQ